MSLNLTDNFTMPEEKTGTFSEIIASLLEKESFDKAEALVLEQLEIEPDNIFNFILLGDVFLSQGRSMEAQIFYEKALDSEEMRQIAREKLAHINSYIQKLKLSPGEISDQFFSGQISHNEFLILLFMIRESDHKIQLIDLIRKNCEVNEENWRLLWRLAREAMLHEQLEAVDDLCNKILTLKSDFWFARELPKHARGYFAQSGQDIFIEKYFALHPPKNKFFIEVGAFDGIHYSNVRRLFNKAGWSGICIEPVESNFQKLTDAYKDSSVICIQAAVSDHDGESILNVSEFPHLPEWGSEASSLVPAQKHKWDKYQPVWKEQKVILRSLNTILEENGVNSIDLLSIDTKGNDLVALQGLDLAKYHHSLIVIEYGDNAEAIRKYAEANEYVVIHDNQQEYFLQWLPKTEIKARESVTDSSSVQTSKKIVGLITVNSSDIAGLHRLLNCVTPFVHSIVLLDTNTDPKSNSIVKTPDYARLVAKTIHPAPTDNDGSGYRNQLLRTGRMQGGTHFIIIDANEIFTANLIENDILKNSILELEPGDTLTLNRVLFWGGTDKFRLDESSQVWNYKANIFADDSKCSYESDSIYAPRVPKNLYGRRYFIEGNETCILDFRSINQEKYILILAWYRMLERILRPQKSATEINQRYAMEQWTSSPLLHESKPEWFAGYSGFDEKDFLHTDNWRTRQMLAWFEEFGDDLFRELDIWDIDWKAQKEKLSLEMAATTVIPQNAPSEKAGLNAKQPIEELMDQAEQFLHSKNPAEAEVLLRIVLSQEPQNLNALNNLAVVKIMQDEFEAAQVILDRLLQISPNDEYARENLNFLRKVRKL